MIRGPNIVHVRQRTYISEVRTLDSTVKRIRTVESTNCYFDSLDRDDIYRSTSRLCVHSG